MIAIESSSVMVVSGLSVSFVRSIISGSPSDLDAIVSSYIQVEVAKDQINLSVYQLLSF